MSHAELMRMTMNREHLHRQVSFDALGYDLLCRVREVKGEGLHNSSVSVFQSGISHLGETEREEGGESLLEGPSGPPFPGQADVNMFSPPQRWV
ncbi:MAG: hypothetical protein D6736_14995 [Nitrospinota bacterium]|nr:MAG: hypothetical protein D6736_14995 [Nitrospinota bacterium]